jgi:hypothetical protein
MNIQLGIPRPRFDVHEHPEYIYIYTLARSGVSNGGVIFNATTDPEHGVRGTRQLEPMVTYPIAGEDGFEGYEYVLPFWELFKRNHTISSSSLATLGTDKYVDRNLVPFVTGGFIVTAKSAFRASPTEYAENTLSFTILMPATGGGILRIADCLFDIANPTFNPHAHHPRALKNLDTERMLNQAHRPKDSAIEDRRAARIRAAEQSMAYEEKSLPGPGKSLPPRRS